MTYSVYICDDNPEVLSSLYEMINRLFGERLNTEIFTSFDAMLEATGKMSPDIVVLDILLNEGNACLLAEKLMQVSPGMQIVFLTGHIEMAEDIFRYITPAGLIFKPVSEEKLFRTLNEVINRNSVICLKNRTEQTIIRACDVLYVESDAKKIKVCVMDKGAGGVNIIYSSTPLSQFIKSSGITFIRCHKSYAVNPLFVRHVSKNEFKLTHDVSVTISRRYYNSACDEYMSWVSAGYQHVSEI